MGMMSFAAPTSSSTTTTTTTRTTVLRVKRPRSVDPVPTLEFVKKKRARQETVDDIAEQLASSVTNISTSSLLPPSSNTLVWKRVETSLTEAATQKQCRKRSLKYVDATLNRIDPKRTKLALTLEKSKPLSPTAKRPKNVILDPTCRLIDQKMKQVQEGSSTLQQYLDFLERDERVRHATNKYLGWTLEDGSTVLHLAALWNNIEEARHILLKYPTVINVDAADISGQRAYQNATLAGNHQVAQVLEAFGADTEDYVYDVFQLVTEGGQEDEKDKGKANKTTVVELQGGVGYLNDDGELILEALCPEDYGYDSEQEIADDDVDSNAEDYEHNDYPEEVDEDEDDDDDSQPDSGFRHNRIHMSHGRVAVNNSVGHELEADAEYDAQYGLYDGSEDGDTQHFYAYDPDLDDDVR